MPRLVPLLSGLDRGNRLNGSRSVGVEAQCGELRQQNLPGHIRHFVGARIKSAHDGNILNSK
jgi:hypothetical protein